MAASADWIDVNPAAEVERIPVRYSGDYDFFDREELDSLVAAAAKEQDAAIYLTAALTGLRRGELVALLLRDVDFAGEAIRVRGNYSHGELATQERQGADGANGARGGAALGASGPARSFHRPARSGFRRRGWRPP